MKSELQDITYLINNDNDFIAMLHKIFEKKRSIEEKIIFEAMSFPILSTTLAGDLVNNFISKLENKENIIFISSSEHLPPSQDKCIRERNIKLYKVPSSEIRLQYASKNFYWSDFLSRESGFIYLYPHAPKSEDIPHDHFGFYCYDEEVSKKVNDHLIEVVNKIEKKDFPIELKHIEQWVNQKYFNLNKDVLLKKENGNYCIRKEYLYKKITAGKLFDQKTYKEFFDTHLSLPYRNEINLDPFFIRG